MRFVISITVEFWSGELQEKYWKIPPAPRPKNSCAASMMRADFKFAGLKNAIFEFLGHVYGFKAPVNRNTTLCHGEIFRETLDLAHAKRA
jgi:hypothetical protein